MPAFDIATLVNFESPSARCPHCLALWTDRSPDWWSNGRTSFNCPTCDSHFQRVVFGQAPWIEYGTMSTVAPGIPIDLGDDALQHAAELGRLASNLQHHDDLMLPLQSLMLLLLRARSFIHATSLNLDEFMLGVLEMAAQIVQVNVVVSGLSKKMRPELEAANSEAPSMTILVEDAANNDGVINHSKLIVIDGLVAVHGSTNLNHLAWRKASTGREIITVDCEQEKVIRLNNSHFSKLWATLTPLETSSQIIHGEWTMIPPEQPTHPETAPTDQ